MDVAPHHRALAAPAVSKVSPEDVTRDSVCLVWSTQTGAAKAGADDGEFRASLVYCLEFRRMVTWPLPSNWIVVNGCVSASRYTVPELVPCTSYQFRVTAGVRTGPGIENVVWGPPSAPTHAVTTLSDGEYASQLQGQLLDERVTHTQLRNTMEQEMASLRRRLEVATHKQRAFELEARQCRRDLDVALSGERHAAANTPPPRLSVSSQGLRRRMSSHSSVSDAAPWTNSGAGAGAGAGLGDCFPGTAAGSSNVERFDAGSPASSLTTTSPVAVDTNTDRLFRQEAANPGDNPEVGNRAAGTAQIAGSPVNMTGTRPSSDEDDDAHETDPRIPRRRSSSPCAAMSSAAKPISARLACVQLHMVLVWVFIIGMAYAFVHNVAAIVLAVVAVHRAVSFFAKTEGTRATVATTATTATSTASTATHVDVGTDAMAKPVYPTMRVAGRRQERVDSTSSVPQYA